MIRIIANNYLVSFLLSALLITVNAYSLRAYSSIYLLECSLLLAQGIILNEFSRKFGILGIKSNLPMVLFSALAVVILPQLSLKSLIVGFIWIISLYFSFMSRDKQEKSKYYLIYIGVALGIAQTLDHYSLMLFIPFFLMFFQNTIQDIRYYILSILYFLMVMVIYTGLLFVMEIPERVYALIPSITFNYDVFNTALIKTFIPFILALILWHLLKLSDYKFRYPNRSIIVNYLLLMQFLIAVFLVILTSATSLFAMMMLPAAILLSVLFSFKKESLIVNAAFIVLILSSLGSAFLFGGSTSV